MRRSHGFVLLRTPWFNIFLHYLDAPNENPKGCHDHPWSFVTLILSGGYIERTSAMTDLGPLERYRWQRPGKMLYRPAEFSHSVTTPDGPSWSLVVVGRRQREWGFNTCES
jgi:hypothetical protein